jgi:hypothetical protein
VVVVPTYLTARYWRRMPFRPLGLLAVAAIAAQMIMTASWAAWWGGGSYGPRLLLDTVPWFVVLTILGVKAFLEDQWLTMPERAAVTSIGLLLLTISVAMNAVGAMSVAAAISWNSNPSIDANPERVWDWEHPQFLAWAQRDS